MGTRYKTHLIAAITLVASLCSVSAGSEAEESKKVSDQNKSLLQAAADGDIDKVKSLLSEGADVNVRGAYGQTALHNAVVKGHRSIVRLLMDKGANIDAMDDAGRTPLHYATGAGFGSANPRQWSVDVVELLLNNGANINAKDDLGWTPLRYSTLISWPDLNRSRVMVRLLLDRGADPNLADNRGYTAYSWIRDRMSFIRSRHYISTRTYDSDQRKRLQTNNVREFSGAALNDIVGVLGEIAKLVHPSSCAYYVAPDGKDTNPGTLERPFETVAAAIDVVEPNDIIYVRGGLHSCSHTIRITKSGEQGRPIRIRAYAGETPTLDFSGARGDAVFVTGAYWHLQGLHIVNGDRGIIVTGSGTHHNVLERITAYANSSSGIVFMEKAAHNIILNCDAYRNFDPQTNGEGSDGIELSFFLGQGNVLIGNRAWNNCDDGFDLWKAGSSIRLEHCYAWRNGQNIWGHPFFSGNANGFKLGQMEGAHVLVRCIAWDHPARGFDLNGNSTGVTIYNCTAFRNGTNYGFFFSRGNIEKNVLRNNISFQGEDQIEPEVDDQHNSWNKPFETHTTEDDFLSLDDSVIAGPRNPDGSIPESGFLRLAPNSDAIDVGMEVGLPFAGKAPDLGTFEYDPEKAKRQSGVKWLHQAVRDHDIDKINEVLDTGTDINEKDWLGYAPLHWACYFGYTDLVELLLSKGADPNLISDTGRIPSEIANSMQYTNIGNLLRKQGAKK